MDVSLTNIFNFIFKVKILFAPGISLKMFCKKGLPQIWTKFLKDISIVISFYFAQKARSFTKNKLLYMFFFFENFDKILFNLFYLFLRYTEICLFLWFLFYLQNSLNPLMQGFYKSSHFWTKVKKKKKRIL